MQKIKLRNTFLKQKAKETKLVYNKQIVICVSILGKAKRSFFDILDIKNLNLGRCKTTFFK